MRLYQDDNLLPLCYESSCPVEELATEPGLDEDARAYLTAKGLYEATMDPTVQTETFKRLRLYEDPKSHAQMEMTWSNRPKQLA